MKALSRLSLVAVLAAGLATGLLANGLNLNGTGAKSDAMGGAFIGLANDFSAAYWNPAGLAQLAKASFSLYGADILPTGTYVFPEALIDARSVAKNYLIPGLGFFTPVGQKLVVGVYVYAPSGAGSTWQGEDLRNLTAGKPFDWNSKLGIFTISPALAFKISDKIMIGATVDINYGMLKMEQPIRPAPEVNPNLFTQYSEDLKGWAVNGTIGLLVKPVKQFSFGLSYKLPFTAKLKGDVTIPAAVGFGLPETDTGTRSAKWPMWIGGGVAIKPIDALTITADVQYTNWKKLQTIPVTFANAGWQAAIAPEAAYQLLWKDTFQYRVGVEYWVVKSFALRAGYYLDENPGPVSTQQILLPEFKYNWLTVGFGFDSTHFAIDAAVQYGLGKDVTVPLAEYVPGQNMPGVHGMKMWVPSLNLIYKF